MNMQSLNDDEKRQVFSELFMDELKLIEEYLQDIPFIKLKVESIDKRLTTVESDMTVVKALLRNHSETLNEHSSDLKQLKHSVKKLQLKAT